MSTRWFAAVPPEKITIDLCEGMLTLIDPIQIFLRPRTELILDIVSCNLLLCFQIRLIMLPVTGVETRYARERAIGISVKGNVSDALLSLSSGHDKEGHCHRSNGVASS